MKYYKIALASLLLGFLTYGCAQLFGERGGPEGTAAPTTPAPKRFEDVPVPLNVELSEDESFVFETDAIRTGVLVYYGNVRVDSLVEFFKVAMAQQGWSLVNSFVWGGAALNFEKANRSAIINIDKGAFMTKLVIRVGPKSPGQERK